ncbi:50S ribosomal protein L25/general stress protein Ctc [Marinococcus luteus]|uniref:50S ribosomal protein L25/general stress protein Ctc n=1 Tax=Marinococcus luteus TaxID=1122204 RepID=UPI002ACC657B|nr:50S ribosomal protein L25/general stress protein Ctc [Marinococcus luteus]MDZ5782432.1 50S ribosomal protein L25/general stress protein Ctc [Marinococcus luteus]
MATQLTAARRPETKQSVTKKLRREGTIPAVIYGKKTESQPISVDNVTFLKTIREAGKNGIIDLTIEGESKKHQVIVHDMQVDSIKDYFIHVDFFEVDMTSEMEADVAVHLEGEAPGEKDGGVVSHMMFNITVSALPAEIPDSISVDISTLNVGDSIQVADLPEGLNYTITSEPEETIVTVLVPEEEPEEPGEEEAAEPELVDADEESEEGDSEEGSNDNNNS